jgi:hypothetical protein
MAAVPYSLWWVGRKGPSAEEASYKWHLQYQEEGFTFCALRNDWSPKTNHRRGPESEYEVELMQSVMCDECSEQFVIDLYRRISDGVPYDALRM